ncbi:hypothetical protein TraAM80_03135 [Trypanosoma rangeli]|uniref:Cilia- and flagella-associated protein 300 n=1 Tax=Trypanosoma rangeli TaxID=5698 RepID=A0A422NQV4_TRYRA|nr:uncharacterized protein TraAM80_03135 [Trypanosoma rangeli]RNF07877.1 hypothetical protein TraAM80_03135 [Trypanosoma rangeli]|eukprot:RNF07877.1 hypothetical protein TraAM80_03135 [Trypanosoma rangeli]
MGPRTRFSFELKTQRRLDAVLTDPIFKEAQQRWGIHSQTRVCAFRFEQENTSGTVQEGASHGGGVVVAGALRFSGFHKGMLQDLLVSFFESTAVREALALCAAPKALGDAVQYTELYCSWTTLEPFMRLVEAGVVRRVELSEDVPRDEAEAAIFDGAVRFPVVRRADVYLPHDIAVTDELRALFLLAPSRAMCHEEEEEEDEAWNTCSYGSGARLSLGTLRGIFSATERSEFLYHIVWRFVAGGGNNNQWDEDLGVYLDLARMWYKSLVAIRAVHTEETTAVAGGMDEPDRAADVDSGALIPEVVSTVVAVQAVGGLSLFARSDEVEPSNLNYCYVCIDPVEAEVVVWYHCL